MGAMCEGVGKDLLVIAIRGPRDAEIGEQRVRSQRMDQFGRPVGRGDDGVVIDLVEVVKALGMGHEHQLRYNLWA